MTPQEHVEQLQGQIDDYLANLVDRSDPVSLYEPVQTVLRSRGKRLRSLLTLLSAESLGADAIVAMPGAAAIEVFHNFTLVHDDIMDKSESRRGEATVHTVWGVPAGILAGDFLLGMAYDLLTRLPGEVVPPALHCFSNMVVRLCEGQALDAEFERSSTVTVADYERMVAKKTGALIVASLEMGGIIGGADSNRLELLGRVGHHLGLAFQIQDDLLDLTADAEDWGKPVGTDFIAGKRAFLLVKAVELEADSGSSFFADLMEAGGVEESRVEEVKAQAKRLGVLDTARSVILREYGKALDTLGLLEQEIPLGHVRWIIERMRTRVR